MKPLYRNGIVRQVDAKTGRARVEFPDADGMASWWLDVNSGFAGASKSFAMPEIGSQVCCLTDDRGEAGVIFGAIYNDKDTPPQAGADEIVEELAGGRQTRYNKKTGERTVKQTAPLSIEIGSAKAVIAPDSISLCVSGVSLKISAGGVEIKGGKVSHNGKNIGDSHKHGGVEPGGGATRPPQ